jgi:hypothetical protein
MFKKLKINFSRWRFKHTTSYVYTRTESNKQTNQLFWCNKNKEVWKIKNATKFVKNKITIQERWKLTGHIGQFFRACSSHFSTNKHTRANLQQAKNKEDVSIPYTETNIFCYEQPSNSCYSHAYFIEPTNLVPMWKQIQCKGWLQE